MDVVLRFSPDVSTQELDALDGKHVRIQGQLRSHDVPASLGQQGHPGRPHVRYYVEVAGSGHYSLVVTREATFETDAPPTGAQDISFTGTVLGAFVSPWRC